VSFVTLNKLNEILRRLTPLKVYQINTPQDLCMRLNLSDCKSTTPAQRAFTLVELLVVLATIAILISILLPSLAAARESGRRVVCASRLRTLAQATNSYLADHKRIAVVAFFRLENNQISLRRLLAPFEAHRDQLAFSGTFLRSSVTLCPSDQVAAPVTGIGFRYLWTVPSDFFSDFFDAQRREVYVNQLNALVRSGEYSTPWACLSMFAHSRGSTTTSALQFVNLDGSVRLETYPSNHSQELDWSQTTDTP
jgi:prepilin-type N-terminal cleavage/methylation domain-containing protein